MNRVKLRDVASVIMGQAPPSKSYNKEGRGVPFVKVANFSTDYPEIIEWTDEPKKMAQEGDILICVVGKVGVTNLGIDAAIGRSVAAIRPDNGKIDQSFLRHFLKSKILQFTHQGQGAIQKVLTSKMLSEINIPKIPIAEQKKIADILDKVDQIRKNVEFSNTIKEQLKDSIFFDLFGDLWFNPHEFPEYDLSDIADYQEGPGILAVDFHDKGVPLLRLKGIEKEYATLDGCNYLLPEKVEQKWKHFCVQKGDILIGSSASVGRVAIVDEDTVGAVPYTGIIRFRINDKLVNKTFLLALLRSEIFIRQVTRMSTGSTIKHFGPTHLKRVRLPVPPLNLQIILDTLYSSINEIPSVIELMTENSQSIIQEMLT